MIILSEEERRFTSGVWNESRSDRWIGDKPNKK